MTLFRGRAPLVAALVILVALGVYVLTDSDDDEAPPLASGTTSDPNDFRTTDEIREEMLEAVAGHPSFAGVYIDGDLGIVVRATDDFDWFEAAIADYTARNRRVSIEPAEYTLAELEAVMSDIDIMEWREERGVPITRVGVDVEANRVQVGVQDLTAAHEAELHDTFGDTVLVAEQDAFEARPGGS